MAPLLRAEAWVGSSPPLSAGLLAEAWLRVPRSLQGCRWGQVPWLWAQVAQPSPVVGQGRWDKEKGLRVHSCPCPEQHGTSVGRSPAR